MVWGKAGKAKQCARRFVEALNAHDFEALSGMMADEFCYIDSWREGVEGREKVLDGLKTLLATDPDLHLDIESETYRDPDVLLSGSIRTARFGDRRAVWLVTCEGDKLFKWQSWAEGTPPPMSRSLAPGAARDLSHRAADRPVVPED